LERKDRVNVELRKKVRRILFNTVVMLSDTYYGLCVNGEQKSFLSVPKFIFVATKKQCSKVDILK